VGRGELCDPLSELADDDSLRLTQGEKIAAPGQEHHGAELANDAIDRFAGRRRAPGHERLE
jgi:hypothetical protein